MGNSGLHSMHVVRMTAAHNSDDNLHCESIEEEVAEAVRGKAGGNVVTVYTGRVANESFEENANLDERRRVNSQKGGKSIIVMNQHH